MTLDNGERQVAPGFDGIRRDHVARYEWVAARLPKGSRVLDLACGVGYGARILADAGHLVTAVDASREAIDYGKAHYAHERINFVNELAEDVSVDDVGTFDALVSFETIEHLSEPGWVLSHWRHYAKQLFASVPNETVFPHMGRVKFHHRHYTKSQFNMLLSANGWQAIEWHGQAGPVSEVEPDIEGRTLIAVAMPHAAEKPATKQEVSLNSAPEHVAIIGLGPSCATFFELAKGLGGASAYCDEVWGINAIGDVLRCDRVFHMDDLLVQEARAKERPGSNIAAMVKWLKEHPGPVYTSIVRPGYPGHVAFPLEEVLNAGHDGTNGGAPYFNSTAAYAVAYAVHIGVKRISLFGIDYTLPNAHKAEQGRACVEFWLGIAAARGIAITVPEQSSLLDACAPEAERLYGYDCADVFLDPRDDGGVSVRMEPKAPPAAAEIEARYDHSKHPNRLMEGKQ